MSEALAVGSLFAHYQIEAELGEGEAGKLYRARDTRSGRRVALKVTRFEGERATSRLRAEIEVLGRLRSRAIAGLLDSGQQDGRLYIVRELVEGASLEQLLEQRGKLTEAEALAVASAVSEGLAAAHKQGIIHRDLKPSNVIVPIDPATPDRPAYGDAKLTDFGAFGRLERELASGRATTLTGQIFGTPIYMSPEQALGRPQSAGADVYGLGILLYEMLYGRPPFEGQSFLALLNQIIQEPPAFPAEVPVSAAALAFLTSCLAKSENDRPADGLEAHRLLQAMIRKQPGPAAGAPSHAEMRFPIDVSRSTAVAAPTPRPATGRVTMPSPRSWGIVPPPRSLLLGGLAAAALTLVAWGLHARVAAAIAIPVSIFAGYLLHGLINRRRPPLQGAIGVLLNRSASATDLRKSIAVDLEQLIAASRQLDQTIMAKTIGILIHEYDRAKKSSDRQEALVRAVSLMEKLMEKLSPWYVRHQKSITWGVAALGSFVGVLKSVLDVLAKTGGH